MIQFFNKNKPKNISVEVLFGMDCIDQPKIGLFLRTHIKKSLENAFSNLLIIPSAHTKNNHYCIHTVFSSGNSLVFNADAGDENIEDMTFKLSFRMLIDSNKQLGELSLLEGFSCNPFEFNYSPSKDKKNRKREFKSEFDNFIKTLLKIKKENVILNIYSLTFLNRGTLISPYIMYKLNDTNKVNIPEFDVLKENLSIMIERLKSNKIIADSSTEYLLLNCKIGLEIKWNLTYELQYKSSKNDVLISKNTQIDILKEIAKNDIIDSFVLDQVITEDNLNDVIDILKSMTY